MEVRMDPVEFAEKMKLALALLDELAGEVAAGSKATVCPCCGLAKRENIDDWQAFQGFEAAANRVLKNYERLTAGAWAGRSLAAIEDASTLREK